MTFLGKILVVTQVLFSLVFMAFAGALAQRQAFWKSTYVTTNTALTNKVKELADEVAQHDLDKQNAAKSITTAEDARKTAQANLDNRTKELAGEIDRHKATTVEKNAAQAQAETAERASKARRDDFIKQRDINIKLLQQQDEQIATITQLRAQIFDLQKTDVARTKKQNSLLEQLALYKEIIEKNKLETDPRAYADKQTPPPTVDGVVRSAKIDTANGTTFVEISLGSDDGLAVGHKLFISRGDKYIGQVKLVNVTPDKSVGTIVKSVKNGIVEEGDRVTSKL